VPSTPPSGVEPLVTIEAPRLNHMSHNDIENHTIRCILRYSAKVERMDRNPCVSLFPRKGYVVPFYVRKPKKGKEGEAEQCLKIDLDIDLLRILGPNHAQEQTMKTL
jgi:hypothetical protein